MFNLFISAVLLKLWNSVINSETWCLAFKSLSADLFSPILFFFYLDKQEIICNTSAETTAVSRKMGTHRPLWSLMSVLQLWKHFYSQQKELNEEEWLIQKPFGKIILTLLLIACLFKVQIRSEWGVLNSFNLREKWWGEKHVSTTENNKMSALFFFTSVFIVFCILWSHRTVGKCWQRFGFYCVKCCSLHMFYVCSLGCVDMHQIMLRPRTYPANTVSVHGTPALQMVKPVTYNGLKVVYFSS